MIWRQRHGTRKLRGEIDANRPMSMLLPTASAGGHSFIIDGYKDESFSVNWGWGGYCNGSTQIGALNPESEGKPTGDKYNVGHRWQYSACSHLTVRRKSLTMGFTKMLLTSLQELNMNVTDVKKGQKVCHLFCANRQYRNTELYRRSCRSSDEC